MQPTHPTILYDGTCILCSGFMQFVAKHDRGLFRFTPIQSPLGQVMAKQLGINRQNPETFAVLFPNGTSHTLSNAAIIILQHLKYFGWTRLFRAIPTRLRDWIYIKIAQNRYQWFGQYSSCHIPPKGMAKRVITEIKSKS